MHKLSAQIGDTWTAHDHPQTFEIRLDQGQPTRLKAGLTVNGIAQFRTVAEVLTGPFFLLYILHTPRGEGEPGRYQSQLIEKGELDAFLKRFGTFLSADARHDFWLHSPSEKATLVWDRHNLLFGYGPVSAFAASLREEGFGEGTPAIPSPHAHHYRHEFDDDATAMLAALDWHWTPLRPEDEQ